MARSFSAAACIALLFLALIAEPSLSFMPSFVRSKTIRQSKRYATRSSSTTSLNMAIDKLNPAETALVLIEYQNEFTTEGGALYEAVKPCLDKYQTIANSKKAMNAARMAGCTIIHVPISFEDGHNEIANSPYGILQAIKEGKTFKAGEWGSAICDTMKPGPSDLIVKGKSGLCGFHSTNLDFVLRQNGIKNVVLGGFLTNCCVESTMRNAYEHGYKVFTLKDCCAATSVEGQEAAFEHTFGMFSIPTTSDELIAAVQG